MSEKRLTFFECHTHGDVQIGPASIPGVGGGETAEAEDADGESDAEEDGGAAGLLVGVVIVVVVLAAIAALVKGRGGDDDDGGELQQVELTETEA